MPVKRVGILGGGNIASYLISMIQQSNTVGLAFVQTRSPDRLPKLDCPVITSHSDLPLDSTDLVIEAAHADTVHQCAASVLEACDFLPMSLTALADPALEATCLEVSQRVGTRLYIPEGAVTGLTAIYTNRRYWDNVTVTMRKNPANIDLSNSGLSYLAGDGEQVLFSGPTREACQKFPRNVNSHAAVALAGIGFDRTRSILIADPSIENSQVEIVALSSDIQLEIRRSNSITGVSGTLTLKSAWESLLRAIRIEPGIELC